MSAVWQNAVITEKGLALQAKAMTGGTVKITSVKTGSGVVSVGSLKDQTEVTGFEQTATIRNITVNPEDVYTAIAEVIITNTGLSSAYNLSQVGFYANDPEEGEILYAIAQATTPKEIPSAEEMPGYSLIWHFNFNLSSEINLDADVTPADLVSVEMMEEAVDEATFIKHGTGENVVLSGSSNHQLVELKVFGKSTQGAEPSPENPQEIESVGDGGSVVIDLLGRNLVSSFVSNSNAEQYSPSLFCEADGLKPNTEYVISFVAENGHRFYKNEYLFAGGGFVTGTGERQFIVATTLPDIDKNNSKMYQSGNGWIIFKNATDNTIVPVFKDVQIEFGAKMTDYEPYKAKQTLTLTTDKELPGIPVKNAASANYTDENGKMWVCDEVDFERGVYVQRIGKYEFTGNEPLEDYDDGKNTGCIFTKLGISPIKINTPLTSSNLSNAMCNVATISTQAVCDTAEESKISFSQWGSSKYVYFNAKVHGDATTLIAAMKAAHSAGKPYYFIYELETPVETALTAEQIAAYKELHTNKPYTTIINSVGAAMMVKYMRDCRDSDYVARLKDKMLICETAYLGSYTCNAGATVTDVYLADKYTAPKGYSIVSALPYTNYTSNTFGLVINTMHGSRGYVFRPHNASSGSCSFEFSVKVILQKN